MNTIRFVHRKNALPWTQILTINEITPKYDSRGRFDASTNHCLKEAIDFLANDYLNSVEIEFVKERR